MNLQTLIAILKNAVQQEYEQTLSLLDELVNTSGVLHRDIVTMRASLNALGRDRNIIDYDEYNIQRNRIIMSTVSCIDKLIEEDLKENWFENEFLLSFIPLKKDNEKKENITISLENIKLSDKLDNKDIFRIKMTSCQDEIAVSNYSQAYKIAEEIKKNIEPQSAQLYEYLLYSYYKNITVEKIIKNFISCDEIPMKHIILYCNRLRQFQNEGFCQTNTGLSNIEIISEELCHKLNDIFLSNKKSYIENTIVDDDYNFVRRSLLCSNELSQHLKVPIVFYENLINEFLGGGVCSWIDLDKNNNLVNKVNFDVFYIIEQIKQVIISKDTKTTASKLARKISNNLYYSLLKKYNSILPVEDNKKIRWTTEKRKCIIECLKAFKIGFCFFKEKRFLKIAIKELKGEGKLFWFEINSNNRGTLESNSFSKLLNYKPVKELQTLIELLNEELFADVKGALLNSCAKNLAEDTMYEYNRLKQEVILEDEKRKKTITCINNWFVCYKITSENKYMQYCFNELTGKGIMEWFVLNNNLELINNYDPGIFLFDVYDKKWQGIISLENEMNDLKLRLVNLEFSKVKKEYDLIKINEEGSNIENRAKMINIYSRLKKMYELTKNKAFLEIMVTELSGNGKLSWIETTFFGLYSYNNSECDSLNFNSITELNTLKSI